MRGGDACIALVPHNSDLIASSMGYEGDASVPTYCSDYIVLSQWLLASTPQHLLNLAFQIHLNYYILVARLQDVPRCRRR